LTKTKLVKNTATSEKNKTKSTLKNLEKEEVEDGWTKVLTPSTLHKKKQLQKEKEEWRKKWKRKKEKKKKRFKRRKNSKVY
jgi:hypothetical protein